MLSTHGAREFPPGGHRKPPTLSTGVRAPELIADRNRTRRRSRRTARTSFARIRTTNVGNSTRTPARATRADAPINSSRGEPPATPRRRRWCAPRRRETWMIVHINQATEIGNVTSRLNIRSARRALSCCGRQWSAGMKDGRSRPCRSSDFLQRPRRSAAPRVIDGRPSSFWPPDARGTGWHRRTSDVHG